MSERLLYIEEELIDLGDDTKVAVTYQINDIAELQNRQANFSNRFKVPKTIPNRKKLGFSDSINSTSLKPYRKNVTKYIQDGYELISNGFCIIEETKDFFVITAYSGIIDLFEKINGLMLSDLDMSDMNHMWDFDHATETIPVPGLRYPLIDYGLGVPTNGIALNASLLIFTVYHQEILKRIFNQAGFLFAGEIFSNPKYLKEINTVSRDVLIHTDAWRDDRKCKASAAADQQHTIGFANPQSISFGNVIFDNGSNLNSPYYIEPPETVRFLVRAVINATYQVLSGTPPPADVRILLDGVQVAIINIGVTGTYVMEATVTVPKGSQVSFDFTTYFISNCVILASSTIEVVEVDPIMLYNSFVDVALNMPEISQSDFIKSFMQRYFLIANPDPYTNQISFDHFKKIYDNKPIAKNMTEFLNVSAPKNEDYRVEFRIGKYAQNNFLKYKNEDYVTENLGRGNITIDDETLPLNTDLFEQVYSATDMVTRLGGQPFPLIKKREAPLSSETSISNTPRILLLEDDPSGGSELRYYDYQFNSLNALNLPKAWFILPLKTFNLGFDNTLIKDYGSEVSYMLNNLKKFTGDLYLKETHIHNLNHLIPWYFEQFSEYFYVNKVVNYQTGKITSTELIRL